MNAVVHVFMCSHMTMLPVHSNGLVNGSRSNFQHDAARRVLRRGRAAFSSNGVNSNRPTGVDALNWAQDLGTFDKISLANFKGMFCREHTSSLVCDLDRIVHNHV